MKIHEPPYVKEWKAERTAAIKRISAKRDIIENMVKATAPEKYTEEFDKSLSNSSERELDAFIDKMNKWIFYKENGI